MRKQLAKNKEYAKLISDLRRILEEGKKRAKTSINQIVVETYWKMGERICVDGAFGEASIRQIARGMDLERTLVGRIVKFYQAWSKSVPVGHTGHTLSWSHYKSLLAIEDKTEREFYLKESFLKDWDRDDLRQKIKDGYAATATTEARKGTEAGKKILERKNNKMYLYSATVNRVIDGDTQLLQVDLGFEVLTNKRIRLRGIDCPELSTPEGQKAKEFVENELKNCFIAVIQTFKKIDVYGRYVCDLFYLEGETDKELIAEEGNFLNQRLLDEGLAELI